jgi:hypothetical protein
MTNPTSHAITANIGRIEQRLFRASTLANAAHEAARRGEQNFAIGTLLPLEQDLADAEALLRTVFVLHRSRPDTTQTGVQ